MKKIRLSTEEQLTVDTIGLQKMLCCGYRSAVRIGKESGAAFKIGNRRLYSVAKIRAFIDRQSEEQAAAESGD